MNGNPHIVSIVSDGRIKRQWIRFSFEDAVEVGCNAVTEELMEGSFDKDEVKTDLTHDTYWQNEDGSWQIEIGMSEDVD